MVYQSDDTKGDAKMNKVKLTPKDKVIEKLREVLRELGFKEYDMSYDGHIVLQREALKEQAKQIIKFISNVTWGFRSDKPWKCSVCKKECFVISDEFNDDICYKCALKKFKTMWDV